MLLLLASAQASGPEQILGLWLTPNGESKIQMSKCGELYCGTMVWMQNPKKDVNNSDPALKGRLLVGVQIASGLKFDGGNSFSGGKLYGPERGNNGRREDRRQRRFARCEGFVGRRKEDRYLDAGEVDESRIRVRAIDAAAGRERI